LLFDCRKGKKKKTEPQNSHGGGKGKERGGHSVRSFLGGGKKKKGGDENLIFFWTESKKLIPPLGGRKGGEGGKRPFQEFQWCDRGKKKKVRRSSEGYSKNPERKPLLKKGERGRGVQFLLLPPKKKKGGEGPKFPIKRKGGLRVPGKRREETFSVTTKAGRRKKEGCTHVGTC